MILGHLLIRFGQRRLCEIAPRGTGLVRVLAFPIVVTQHGASDEQHDQQVVVSLALEPKHKVIIQTTLGQVLSLYLAHALAVEVAIRFWVHGMDSIGSASFAPE